MKKIRFTALMLILFSAVSFGQKSPVYIKSNAAIGGYDPVAYFTMHKPVMGMASHNYNWNGADWHFSNAENMAAFKASPEKYAPQYGGYCAYGLADGHKAPTEPDAWTISDGKLFLNYNKAVQASWLKDKNNYIIVADKKWPELMNKE